jgi:TRAP-type C4-dicarboxylate transport system permease small subunit
MKKVILSINSLLMQLSKFLCFLGGVMMVIMMLITSVDVFMRTFLDTTFPGASVLVRNMLVVAMFLGLPYVTFVRGHTRSEVLYEHVGDKGKLILNIIAEIIGMAMFALMAYALIKPTSLSFTTSQFDSEGTFIMPMSPFYVLALFGAWFTLYAAIHNVIELLIKLRHPEQAQQDEPGEVTAE